MPDKPTIELYVLGEDGVAVEVTWTIIVDEETPTCWRGRPVNNPKCPVLEWPKLVWVALPGRRMRKPRGEER